MRTVSHREMRNNSGEMLRAVAAGERVQVTNNGQVAALIVPADADPVDDLIARGLATPATRPLSDLRSIRRSTSRTPSAEIVADIRRDR